jgi:hypothetical protein
MTFSREIQQNTDRTGRTAGNPAICGDIGQSALTTISTRTGGFIARILHIATAGLHMWESGV